VWLKITVVVTLESHKGFQPQHVHSLFIVLSVISMESQREEKEEVQLTKEFSCDMCSKIFKLRFHLKQHLKVHKEEKKKTHKCDFCSKAFKLKTDLIRHTRTHTGKRPFKCVLCQKAFA